MINMETLFEFYTRIILKRTIDQDKYSLDSYSKRLYIHPGAESRVKIMRSTGTSALPLAVDSVDYYELIFGNDSDNAADALNQILP